MKNTIFCFIFLRNHLLLIYIYKVDWVRDHDWEGRGQSCKQRTCGTYTVTRTKIREVCMYKQYIAANL